MLMSIQRTLLALGTGTFAFVVNAYAYLHATVLAAPSGVVASATEECVETKEGASKENPHKMLFVSCGGFLE